MIDIAGKSKAEILRRLFNAARTKQTKLSEPNEKGERIPVPKTLTLKQAQELIEERKVLRFSKLGDRELHIDLRGEEFDEIQYDNRNGWGTAEKALQGL